MASFDQEHCLEAVTITFTEATSTPVVEVFRDIRDVLSFYPTELASTPHAGVWLDSRTVRVSFLKCYVLGEDEVIQLIMKEQLNDGEAFLSVSE